MHASFPSRGRAPDRVSIENHRGQAIRTVADWQRLAPPASPQHWREYRSAFELAWAWTEGDGAERLGELVDVAPALAGVRLERAIAERKTHFDDIPGGPRNHDLLVLARTLAGRVVIGVEAKADETFDRDLAGFRSAALRRQPATRAPERLDRLTRAFLGTTLDDDPSLGTLRYQLFAALAGTLAEAARFRAIAAVLLVHEFVTPLTDASRRRRNASDLEAFVARLGPAPRVTGPRDGWLAGPFTVPGNGHLPGDVPVYVGKLTTQVETRGPAPVVAPADPPAPPIGRPLALGARSARIEIPFGARVIKLNRHADGCPCGCAGREAYVANRPGRHPRQNVRTSRLPDAIRQVRAWALDAIADRDRARQNPASTFAVGGGMTTVTLLARAAGATPRFTVTLWDTGAVEHSDDLDTALERVEHWIGS